MKRSLLPLWRAWRIFILSWASAHLSKHNPMHPDLPEIVTELNVWRNGHV